MTGRVRLIINDLQKGIPIKAIALKNNISVNSIYQCAERYNIDLPEITRIPDEEKKRRKRQTDAKRYDKEKEFKLERPDIDLPMLPPTVTKLRGLAACNSSWAYNQARKLSSTKERFDAQQKYGLRT